MKKLVMALTALLAIGACTKEKAPFNYKGLDCSMPVSAFVDSMVARGYAVDTAASDSGRTWVLANPADHFRVLVAFDKERLQVVQDTYTLSSNDSTRNMWQQLRDGLEQELGAWPNCPILKDDHRVADFDIDGSIISVVLENTYTPTLTVRYTPKQAQ